MRFNPFVLLGMIDEPPAQEKYLTRFRGFLLDNLQGLLRQLEEHVNRLNGQLTYGDGTEVDNILGTWYSYTSGVPGADDTITHNLGVIPVGIHVMIPPASGIINKGVAAWTTTTLSLRCTTAGQTATLFILAPPQQKT